MFTASLKPSPTAAGTVRSNRPPSCRHAGRQPARHVHWDRREILHSIKKVKKVLKIMIPAARMPYPIGEAAQLIDGRAVIIFLFLRVAENSSSTKRNRLASTPDIKFLAGVLAKRFLLVLESRVASPGHLRRELQPFPGGCSSQNRTGSRVCCARRTRSICMYG